MAEPKTEEDIWTWIVFSTDTLPFKCEDCLSAQLYWVRIMPSYKTENVRLLEEYLANQELDTNSDFAIKTWHEVDLLELCFIKFFLVTNLNLHGFDPDGL